MPYALIVVGCSHPDFGWHCRLKKGRNRGLHTLQPMLPELPQAPPRSEAAKEAEAEQTAKHLKQQLPAGPEYLDRDDLVDAVKPSDAQMALCALYSNRCSPRSFFVNSRHPP